MKNIYFPSNTRNSKAQGRFEDGEHTFTDAQGNQKTIPVIWLRTRVPGLDNSGDCVRVKDNENGAKLKKEYSLAWEDYIRRKGAPPVASIPTATEYGIKGTPIETANFLGKDHIHRLKLNGFYTLEQLAEMSDAQCNSIGFGAQGWRKRAAEQIIVQNDGPAVPPAPVGGPSVADLMAQLAEANAKIAALMDAVMRPAEPKPQIEEQAVEAPKPRRGRPPKDTSQPEA